MIKRLLKVINFLYTYISKGEVRFDLNNFTVHVDKYGNLFVFCRNLILNTEEFKFWDCDQNFAAKVMTYMLRGEEEKLKALIDEEVRPYMEESKLNLSNKESKNKNVPSQTR
jgi:hypothetical protein